MSSTVSDFVIERLYGWGIRRIFGYPGDGINGLMGALRRREGGEQPVEFVQSRHEELAAFMACAHAKFTGEVGVCMATSGPGAIHLLNGLYDAAKDHTPVLAIVGQQSTASMGADYQQEVDLISLFKDVAHHYVHMCHQPASARHQVDQAMRIAKAERAVTCIILPNDVQEMPAVESPERSHGTTFSGIGYDAPEITPKPPQLEAAAEVLNSGQRVAMLVGAGALGASAEIAAAAERLNAGVAKALLGKAVLPDDLLYVTGGIGLLGTEPSDFLMSHCDTLLMVGTSFPYSEWLPKEGSARAVQIDVSPRSLGLRYPTEVNLHGEAGSTLRALLPLLQQKDNRRWRQDIAAHVTEWWKVMEARAMADAKPINPQRVFWELSPLLPNNSILCADSGSSANWYARDLKIRRGMLASLSGGLATMGCGVPYALAAKLAYPERPVFALVGDGAMQMNGINGLITIADRWKDWANPQLIILVLNNGDLNQVTWEQRVMAGDPKYETSQNLPQFSYVRYAESLGLEAVLMENVQGVAAGWRTALAAKRPVLVEAITDPEVPPLPPHISLEQAKGYMQSIFKGDPSVGRMIRQSAKQLKESLKA